MLFSRKENIPHQDPRPSLPGNGPEGAERATFAAGCFWGVEAAFREIPGVLRTTVGYTDGHTENPTYDQVCSHKTGHAEAVEIWYDPQIISYQELVDFFFTIHNPTTRNRQGWDIGDQYRSAIFYHSSDQEKEALQAKEKAAKNWKKPIVTDIKEASAFYDAEEWHQRYLEKQGRTFCSSTLQPV